MQSSSLSDFILSFWLHMSPLLHAQMKSQPYGTTCGSPSYHALSYFLVFDPVAPSAYNIFPYPPLSSWWRPARILLQVYSVVTFTRLNYKLLLLGSSSTLYTLWQALFSLYCSYLFMSVSATRLWAPWKQEMSHSFLYLKCLANA